jgi:hypothetical protein
VPERAQPDLLLLHPSPDRLPDWGPRYSETPADPLAHNAPFPAEPWNTVTATFFVAIVFVWLYRLRKCWRNFPFVLSCLPILLAGGIGGTLYHATRSSAIFFLLDVIPISLLGLAGAIYLTWRLGRQMSRKRLALYAMGLLIVYLGVNFAIRLVPNPPKNLPVNLSYASLAVVILLPMLGVLMRTGFRHGHLVLAGLACFGIAWFCRLIDNTPAVSLPMGTHWLWHTFGAITTVLMFEYFTRLEQESDARESNHFRQ